MKFSTSSSALSLLALAATTFSPDSLMFASAKPLLLSKEKENDNNESLENGSESTTASGSSPQFETPADPSLNGSLSLVGLDPRQQLTKAEAKFLEETLRDVFNMFPQENGMDLVTRSVSIQQDIVNVPNDVSDGGINNGKKRSSDQETEDHTLTTIKCISANDVSDGGINNGKKRSLRSGDRGPHLNNDKMHFRDDEMCEYKFGPLKGEVIPGCKFDISYYRDCYCHNCDDDFQPNDTRHPSSAPSVHPLRKFLNNLDDDNPPNDTRHPSAAPSSAPSWAPTSSSLPSSAPVSALTNTGVQISRSPKQPSIYQIHMMNKKFCKILKASGFPHFKKVRKCQFSRGSIFKNLGGN
eukprot:CAMPEP_0168309534 /NCGR_PEP_ID=MMETSP0142_2-20121227/66329_1 /TAXON_ID=44445 /ORGANISM="Pseudo-nitzschia australis, Strain 10249 10 AB" /LENGTH=353 /DNA_ID=CAMNT_0008262261 /DNA_START=22 /DNA_END=1084 /DNA_ORIENTATION=-